MIVSIDEFNQVNEGLADTFKGAFSGFQKWLSGNAQVAGGSGVRFQRDQRAPSVLPDADLNTYYGELQKFANQGQVILFVNGRAPITNKIVADVQVGLSFLGYQLPQGGVDGVYGDETAAAVLKFNNDNYVASQQPTVEKMKMFEEFSEVYEYATPVNIDAPFINKLIAKLKEKGFSQANLSAISNSAKQQQQQSANLPLIGRDDEDFYKAVITGLGANPTPEKLLFMHAWRQGEGGRARNNPFNTTMPAPGATDYNSVHVKNYPDRQTGLNATIRTLQLKYYRDLVAMLRNDNITARELARAQGLHTWGTGDNAERVLAQGNVNPPAIAAEE